MLSKKQRIFVSCSLLLVAGCSGSPTIDTSSDYALKSSLANIKRNLSSDSQRRQFEVDCAVTVYRNAPGSESRVVPEKAAHYEKLKGKTAQQVHNDAERYRYGAQMATNQTGSNDRPDEELSRPAQAAPEFKKGLIKALDPRLVPDPAWVVKPGDRASLFDPVNQMVYFCRDAVALAEFHKATSAKDQATLDNMRAWGRATLAEHGTSVEVIEYHVNHPVVGTVPAARVSFREGAHMGREGWVTAALLVSLVDPSVLAGRLADAPKPRSLADPESPAPAKGKSKTRPQAKPGDDSAEAQLALENGLTMEGVDKPDEALRIYKDLVRKYPKAPASSEAKKRIDALTRKSRKN